jgi:hypothetical protein
MMFHELVLLRARLMYVLRGPMRQTWQRVDSSSEMPIVLNMEVKRDGEGVERYVGGVEQYVGGDVGTYGGRDVGTYGGRDVGTSYDQQKNEVYRYIREM